MIVNAYGILAILIAGAQSALGVGLLVQVARARRVTALGESEESRQLLVLLVLVLAALSVVALVVWAVLLQSYVPQFRGLRCVTGVLRVGESSAGLTGWLPALAQATTWLGGALLLLAGSCAVLHWTSRDAAAGALGTGHLLALGALGVVALAAAGVQAAYILIPKLSPSLSAGCCSTTAALPASFAGSGAATSTTVTFAVTSAVLCAGFLLPMHWREQTHGLLDLALIGLAIGALVTGFRFAAEVVAPAQLGLPQHGCVPCLAVAAPETTIGLTLLAAPLCAAVWGAAALRLAPIAGPSRTSALLRLRAAGAFSAVGAVVFLGAQWVVA